MRRLRVDTIHTIQRYVILINTYADLKGTVEKLDGDVHDKQQAVTQLKNDNTKLQKLLHEKEEQLKKR